jgi:hypothetical protein
MPLLAAGCSTVMPNAREVVLSDGTLVYGRLSDPVLRRTEFVSLFFEDAKPGAAMRTEVVLHFRQRDFKVRDLTPKDLEAIGVAVEPTEYRGDHAAWVGYGEQNREGALGFRFERGRLRAFEARCFVPARCDFALSWPSRPRIRLPLENPDVSAVFGAVTSARDYFRH